MNLVGNIYNRLPITVQTLALNIYGLRNLYRKIVWESLLEKLNSSQYWEQEKQIVYVSKELRSILAHAIKTVPYYMACKSLLPHIKDPGSDVFSILLEFPKISRSIILEDPSAFLSKKPKTSRVIKTLTSGTTGTPFATWMNSYTFTLGDALGWRRTLWAGYKKRDWTARLVGDPIIPLDETNPMKPWRISWPDKRIYLSAFHLNKTTAKTYLNILEERKPAFLMGYPSALEILSEFAMESGHNFTWQPKAVLFSSEPLYDHQKEKINSVFNAPTKGFYGSAERIISAAQCENNIYHLSLVDGYIEGQFGILPFQQPALATTLTNTVMPLIRFSLGDNISFNHTSKCNCGRILPIMNPVVTKEEDYILTLSGRKISSSLLTWAFKGVEGIRKSQIIQIDRDSVYVYVDIENHKFDAIASILKMKLDKMFFHEMKIEIIWKDDIQVSKSGKTRFVINKYA